MGDSLAHSPRGAAIVDCSSFAATTFLLYDTLLNLDDEVRWIWTKPNSYWMKWLYLFVRYFALAFQLSLLFVGTDIALIWEYSHRGCVAWYIYQEVATEVLIACVEVILITRVRALYHSSTIISRTLYVLFVAENVTMVAILATLVPDVEFNSICVVTYTPSKILFFALAFILFETILFLLTLVKFISALRMGWGNVTVLTVLIRDGTWAFAVIFGVLCINAGFYLGAGSSISAVAYQWIISIEAFAGCHLILNMHTFEQSHESTDVLTTQFEFTTGMHIASDNISGADADALDSYQHTRHALSHLRGRVDGSAGTRVGVDSEGVFEMMPKASGSGSESRSSGSRSGGSIGWPREWEPERGWVIAEGKVV